jgi:hypothetical protein
MLYITIPLKEGGVTTIERQGVMCLGHGKSVQSRAQKKVLDVLNYSVVQSCSSLTVLRLQNAVKLQ